MRNGVVGVAIAAAVVDAIVGSVVVVVFVVDSVVVVVVIVMGVGVAVAVGDSDGGNGDNGKVDNVYACAIVEGYSVVENNTSLWYWKSVMDNISFI